MKENELVEQLVSAITNNDKEFSFDHQQIREALQEYGLAHVRSHISAQVGAAVEACAKHRPFWKGLALVCSCGKWTYASYADKEGTQVQAQWEEHILSLGPEAAREELERIKAEARDAEAKLWMETLEGKRDVQSDYRVATVGRAKAEARLEGQRDILARLVGHGAISAGQFTQWTAEIVTQEHARLSAKAKETR